VTAGFADGSVVAFKSGDTGSLSKVREWRETRLREGHRFLGLAASAKLDFISCLLALLTTVHALRGIFSCTSNGALRYVSPEEGDNVKLASVPTRLEDWQMAANREFFAYGGNEVDLSVWDTERAFSSPEEVDKQSAAPRKRKRDELLPGEIWRAKNVCNLCHPFITYR
jgi:ribosome biogenesis protein NSA1